MYHKEEDIFVSPGTVWSKLKNDYEKLVTSYTWHFTMEYQTDIHEYSLPPIRTRWTYQTYILLANGGKKVLGENEDRNAALEFHKRMEKMYDFL